MTQSQSTRAQSTLVKVQPDDNSPVQNGISSQYVSEERYWAEHYENSDFHHEWNHGRLEEKPIPDYAQHRHNLSPIA